MTIAYTINGYRQIWTPDSEIGIPSRPISTANSTHGRVLPPGSPGDKTHNTVSRRGLLRPETMTQNPNPDPDYCVDCSTHIGRHSRLYVPATTPLQRLDKAVLSLSMHCSLVYRVTKYAALAVLSKRLSRPMAGSARMILKRDSTSKRRCTLNS
jgi:hypothetical protein